ncbi:hypothetical protein HAP48_0044870 [Bradyrhizobium septentrionale]|uniref:Uncharacterized protein n=1 Tax=Bradyrhizobium septentrionale TaxID=1404411 RepID=A0A973W3E1_9BRAD|nr:hypothetical protein [Bradyrhizobium septentrionale]UGY15574.1 hypothetical protein HAP48_0044870 [Bradyrhizobium septentrionale]UGY24154.1 hypothetical protein HU675_0040530 [Bradyrhizobium septentrionale]
MEVELRWSVSYADAEGILARIHRAGDVQQAAFRARLKHLKRLGIPLESSPGRGAKIWYFEEQMWQWAIALELAEFGIDPGTVAEFIKENWSSDLLPNFKRAMKEYSAGKTDDLLLVLHPNLMQSGWAADKVALEPEWRRPSEGLKITRLLAERRTMIVNVSELCRQMGLAKVAVQSSRKPGGSVGNNS